jgi:hypothetical protein
MTVLNVRWCCKLTLLRERLIFQTQQGGHLFDVADNKGAASAAVLMLESTRR